MFLRSLIRLIRNRQLVAALKLNALHQPFYRITWLVAAKNEGVLDKLSGSPVPFDELAATYPADAKSREALEAWLQLGVRLGLLHLADRHYSLHGLARLAAEPQNDASLALAQEVVGLHHKLILETPARLRAGEFWNLSDQDGELIARSSRALEAFQAEAIDRTFPSAGPVRLLEIGCGSAYYIRYAASKNPSLSAVGLELQPAVAEMARSNVRQWGLDDRVTIEDGDIRDKRFDAPFAIATLHNNIYYFPVDERVALLAHVRECIEPGGMLLLTTCCQGGNAGMYVLNLWGAATAGGGRLPGVDEMKAQLAAAGFVAIDAISLIPGDRYYAFHARRWA